MSGTNGTVVLDSHQAVIDWVRERQATAVENKQPKPGRNVLAAELEPHGVNPHQVRRALEAIRQEAKASRQAPANQPPAPAREAHAPQPDVVVAEDAGGATVRRADSQPATNPPPVRQPATSTRGAGVVAWAGFVFGSLMSTAANVLYTWLPASHQPPGWTPGLAPQVGAAVWPIALLISVEVLSRVPWRRGWLWGVARYGGAGLVAVGSGIISYGHLRGVLLAWQYGHPAAEVGPLVLDGLMVVSGFALLAMSSHQDTRAGAR